MDQLAMTEAEINERVARKLGWEFVPEEKGARWRLKYKSEYIWAFDVPDYCHSIAAAWPILTDYCDEWHLDCRRDVSACLQKNYVTGAAEADTAPLAICQAFLKLPVLNAAGPSAAEIPQVQHL